MAFKLPGDRCKCGYFRRDHEPETGRCPLCQCGNVPAAHVPLFDPPAPLKAREHKSIPNHCPGKPKTKAGAWPALRRGSFELPPPRAEYVTRPLWGPILFPAPAPVVEVVEEVVRPPIVPARPPQSAGEIAGWQGKQAVGLGKLATAQGWRVDASYWLEADEVEGCAVKLARGDLRAVATWSRAAGNRGSKSGWRAELAYGWQLGTMPIKLDVTTLEKIIRETA